MSAAAQALPAVGLMLLAHGRAQTAHGVRYQVLRGRRLSALEAMALDAMERGVANDVRQCRDLLRCTAAANDELAAPAQA